MTSAVAEWKQRSADGLSVVIIDFSPVNDLDASALRTLQDLLKELREQELRLLLASCKGPVRDIMQRSGFLKAISPSSLCVSLAESVKYGARIHALRVTSERANGESGADSGDQHL